jgi:hypothetical protein
MGLVQDCMRARKLNELEKSTKYPEQFDESHKHYAH